MYCSGVLFADVFIVVCEEIAPCDGFFVENMALFAKI